MNKLKELKENFDSLYAEWEKVIQDPKIQLSSRPQDYVNNEPYNQIVKLGKDALPFIIEKIEHGIFFMNEAALKIADINIDTVIEEENKKKPEKRLYFLTEKTPEFLSEQQKSDLILKYIEGE